MGKLCLFQNLYEEYYKLCNCMPLYFANMLPCAAGANVLQTAAPGDKTRKPNPALHRLVEYTGTLPVHRRGSAYFTIFGTCKTRTMPFQIKIKLFVGAVRRDICRDDLFFAGVTCGRHVPCYVYFTRSNVSGPLFILTQQSKSNKPPAQRWWRCSRIGPGRSRSTCTHPRSRRRTAPGQWPSPGWACCRW